VGPPQVEPRGPLRKGLAAGGGRESEYQVLPESGYCDCSDFYFRVVNGEAGLCYHLMAQRLAEALEEYEEVREEDKFYEPLMEEWRNLSAGQAQ